MGTEFSKKQIKDAIVKAAKAAKLLGERDLREDRAFDGESFGINLSAGKPSIEKEHDDGGRLLDEFTKQFEETMRKKLKEATRKGKLV